MIVNVSLIIVGGKNGDVWYFLQMYEVRMMMFDISDESIR